MERLALGTVGKMRVLLHDRDGRKKDECVYIALLEKMLVSIGVRCFCDQSLAMSPGMSV